MWITLCSLHVQFHEGQELLPVRYDLKPYLLHPRDSDGDESDLL